jgi:hypothetical protein
MPEEIGRGCCVAIDAGYRNIDIDSSIFDSSRSLEADSRRAAAGELPARGRADGAIRTLESDGVTISVRGGGARRRRGLAPPLRRIRRRFTRLTTIPSLLDRVFVTVSLVVGPTNSLICGSDRFTDQRRVVVK